MSYKDVSVASRRCGRRGTRLSCAIAPQQAGRTATDAQALFASIAWFPSTFVTDRLPSYAAARAELPLPIAHEKRLATEQPGRELACSLCGDGSEDASASGQPDRLRDSFRHMPRSYNTFNICRHLITFCNQASVPVPRPSRHGASPWALQPETAFIAIGSTEPDNVTNPFKPRSNHFNRRHKPDAEALCLDRRTRAKSSLLSTGGNQNVRFDPLDQAGHGFSE